MTRGIKWLGTAAGVAGALVVALNVPWSGWGFALFLVSSVSWGIAAVAMREPSLAILQGVFTVINLLGIWRWLV